MLRISRAWASIVCGLLRRVVRLLEEAKHEAIAVNLPGDGLRALGSITFHPVLSFVASSLKRRAGSGIRDRLGLGLRVDGVAPSARCR